MDGNTLQSSMINCIMEPHGQARGTLKYSASPKSFHVLASQQLSADEYERACLSGEHRAEAENPTQAHLSPPKNCGGVFCEGG